MRNQTYTLEEIDGTWWLCVRGTYDRNSVLEGQDYRQLCKAYDSLDEAKRDNPGVKINTEGRPYQSELSTSAPRWFDPDDAGEAWGEDDY